MSGILGAQRSGSQTKPAGILASLLVSRNTGNGTKFSRLMLDGISESSENTACAFPMNIKSGISIGVCTHPERRF